MMEHTMAESMEQFLDRFDEWIGKNDHYRTVLDLFRSLNEESPRGMVLVIASELDRLLFEAIKRMLRDGPGLKEMDKDTDGPISTFSARINLAHALRIIDDAEYRDLHIIRRIRNDFAHRRDGDFETESVKSRIRDLSKSEKHDSPAESLERVAMFLIMNLEAAIAGLAEYELPVPKRIYGPDAR